MQQCDRHIRSECDVQRSRTKAYLEKLFTKGEGGQNGPCGSGLCM